MLNFAILLFGWILILCGIIFIFSSVIGIIRFPDFYSRLHASGISDSFGIPLTLLGLSVIQDNFLITTKLIFLAVIIFVIAPSNTHALIKAAYFDKK